MNKKPHSQDASIRSGSSELSEPILGDEPSDPGLQARRLKSYSTDALAAALPIDRIYVAHSRFKSALDTMDRVFQLAREVTVPYGFRLIGETGVGKSALYRYFRDSLPRTSLFAPGLGVVGVRVGARPRAGQLVAALLHAYRYPFKYGTGGTVYARKEILFDLIREKGTRLIFLDEAQHLLNQGRTRRADDKDQEPEATTFVRELMDEANVAIGLAGTDLLDHLPTVDSHLADRAVTRHELQRFDQSDVEWAGILRAFVKQCRTYDLGFIAIPDESLRLHAATGGSLRRLKNLLIEAVLIAVDAHKLTLDAEVMRCAVYAIRGEDALVANPYA